MKKIIYRAAAQTDAPAIAPLTVLASGGMIEFLFQDFAPTTRDLLDVLTIAIANHFGELSYRNTTVAIADGVMVGMANSYPAAKHRMTETMKNFFAPERLVVIQDFYQSRVEGSFYLSTIAVKPEFRCQGIGTQLLKMTQNRAKEEGFSHLSLIVWSDNLTAIHFYKKQAFEEVKRVKMGSHPLLPHRNGCLLMNCSLV